jgi:hypothetical protein
MIWRVTNEVMNEIDKAIIDYPGRKITSKKSLKTPVLKNKEKFQKILFERKKLIFGDYQGLWSLYRYEKSLYNSFDSDEHEKLFDFDVSNWIFPTISRFNFKIHENQEQYSVLLMNKFDCMLMMNARALNVDFNHAQKYENENSHHLGVCVCDLNI